MAGAWMSTWDDVTWSHSSSKKSKCPQPGAHILSQIPEGGECNRGQMPHTCQEPPPTSGITLINAKDYLIKMLGITVIINNWIIVLCNSSNLIGLVALVYEPLYHAREMETIKLSSEISKI